MNPLEALRRMDCLETFFLHPLKRNRQRRVLERVSQQGEVIAGRQLLALHEVLWLPHTEDILLREAVPWGVEDFRKLPVPWWILFSITAAARYNGILAAYLQTAGTISYEHLKNTHQDAYFEDIKRVTDVFDRNGHNANLSESYNSIVTAVHRWRQVASKVLPVAEAGWLRHSEYVLMDRIKEVAVWSPEYVPSDYVIDLV